MHNLAKAGLHGSIAWDALVADTPSPSTAKVSLAATGPVAARPTGTLRFVLTIRATGELLPFCWRLP